VKLVYFAWVRERIGVESEDVALPANVRTTGELLAWLKERGPGYEHALSEPRAIRVAVDKVHARGDVPLAEAREVAIFPPMTGG
jgi:molybdopterin synthase sulfur carrier subunit